MDKKTERLQAYLAAPTEAEAEAIKALAAQDEKRLLKDIANGLEKVKAAGMEKALFYDQSAELERAYRTMEITEEEYKNNPLKSAYEEYAQVIPYRVVSLSWPCLMRAIVTTPDYKSAIDKAIKRAEKLIKDMQKATGSNAETTAFIVDDLILEICALGYAFYHPQESNERIAFTKKHNSKLNRLLAERRDLSADAASVGQQMEELSAELRREEKEYARNIYKADKARIITEQILGRIFPEQKPAIRRGIEARSELEGFYLLAQSPASNKLTKKLAERMAEPAQFDIFGTGSIKEKDFRLFVKGYNELPSGVSETAARLLDCLMITATRNGLQNTLVLLPIREYLDMRGLKDEKEIRRQVKSDIEALERISFEYRGTGKNQGAWLKVSISGGTVGQIKNGDIVFRFNQDFFDSFKVGTGNRYLYMYFPREALSGNIKENPWKYWLGRKITEHKRMNIGKPNADIISVKTLIDACPNYPTYEQVKRGTRAISRRIIEPFERDLDALSPSLSWEYKGLPESPRSYQEFINSHVVIHWSAYPDTQGLETGKKQRAKKQQANKEKATKKKGG